MFQTLSGCVESVEDHGYLVDIGISGTKAFLPKKSIASKQGRIILLFSFFYIFLAMDIDRVAGIALNSKQISKTR